MSEFAHTPVLAEEVVELFVPIPTGVFIDCTIGGGGHAKRLLRKRPDLFCIGIDRDATALEAAAENLAEFDDRVRLVHDNFQYLTKITENEGNIVGILFDLGVSSPQLDNTERGFSYHNEAPLDMRMDVRQPLKASEVVNTYSEEQLEELIRVYGEERFANRVAHAIVAARPIKTTRELAEGIKNAIPAATRRRGPHPARRTFQAIRMEVNSELENLESALHEAVNLIGPEGRVAVLSYHSLEDRIVKTTFNDLVKPATAYPILPVQADTAPARFQSLSRRPIAPSADEIAKNPRARSARLRAVQRLNVEGQSTS